MRDLRKQALESGKTVSRKARSKTNTPSPRSPMGSRPSSRPATPRNGSRNVSDDEGELSDATEWSVHSIDELIAGAADNDLPQEAWIADLEDRINEICDRKRSSVQGREETLQAFNMDLTRHYAYEEIKPKVDELLPAVLKSVKSGVTERETVLGLKALALMLITVPSETIYDSIESIVKATISDAQHPTAKIAAMHVLSIATFYGGATTEETESVMEFFLDIASTDGAAVSEEDNADIVVTALEEWGFLATQLDDMEDITETAMETFVDQLDSSDVGVQIAAGENIALLFEKSYTEVESDEEPDEDDIEGEGMVKRYTVYRQTHQLSQRLEQLAKASTKRVSKKDRKQLHLTFTDILNTIEKPTRGPRYSTALDEDGREFGSRMKINIGSGRGGDDGKMSIDKWWKLHRLNGLKRLLQSGFLVHYELNQVVFDSLPVIVEED